MALLKKSRKSKQEKALEEELKLKRDKRGQLAGLIESKVKELDGEITIRNNYMNERDSLLNDSDYIIDELNIQEGFDQTKYNILPRANEIHTSQVMGRGFGILAKYNKIDLSDLERDSEEYNLSKIQNKKMAAQAAATKNILLEVIKQNGGMSLFQLMAKTASASGTGLIKTWYDKKEKQYRMVPMESPQLFIAGWSDDNFRERDFEVLYSRISLDSANRLYKDKLLSGEEFSATEENEQQIDSTQSQTTRKMCNKFVFSGMMPGINNDNPFHAVVVGGIVVEYSGKADDVPRYWVFSNKVRLRRPWGASDITDEAIDINKTYIETLSDYRSLINKVLFPLIKAKGFTEQQIPKREQRSVQVFAMDLAQDLEVLNFSPMTYPYDRFLQELKEALFRALALGRVFMDDPSLTFESNQALMTGMKPTIDAAEDKQTRWKPIIVEMFEDCLYYMKKNNKEIADLIGDDIQIDIEWPSVLRKEDASYNTMLFTDVSRGVMSVETYLEKKGYADVSEELDRIKNNVTDPILGAIIAANLGMLNSMELNERYQNMMGQQDQGSQQGVNQQGVTNAPLTTDQNNQETQPASAPMSGAPAVSPIGGNATMMQNNGV